jgi:AraC-like DNA-binding protein
MENGSTSEVMEWRGAGEARILQPAADATSGVISVLAAAEELATCHGPDQVQRRAVELMRDRIGLERVSLFLLDESDGSLRGTWATGRQGELVDERHVRRAQGEVEREAQRRVDAGVGRWLQLRDVDFGSPQGDGTMPLGRGWQALTPVRSLRAPLGMVYNDTAYGKAPFDSSKQVRLALFASLIGNVLQSLREPAALSSNKLPASGVKYGAVVRRAIAVLSEDPTITAQNLATRLNVSAARVARAFRSELGVSLVQYRNRLRLERFFGLVQQRGGNFADAAESAGFGSYAQFHRIFRQQVGVTPREYLTGSRPG